MISIFYIGDEDDESWHTSTTETNLEWGSLSSKSTVDRMEHGTDYLFWGSCNNSRKEEACPAAIFVNGHFAQKKNLSYERFKFHSATTNSSEGFLSYLTRLKKLARSCNFDDYSTEDAIVDHYIRTCGSDTVKRKLLTDENLDLATMTVKVSSMELVESQVKVMDLKPNSYEEVNEISNRGTGKRVFICYGCGEPGHAIHSTDCPARNIICSKCGTKGHYVRQCLKKGKNLGSQVHELSVKEEEGLRDMEEKLFSMKVKEDDYLF